MQEAGYNPIHTGEQEMTMQPPDTRTAIEQYRTAIEQYRKEIEQRRFEAMAHQFFERWQPEDTYEAHQFSAELFSLVRQIYIDALAPNQELMRKFMSCLPLQVKP